MKNRVSLTSEQVNALNPKHVVLTQWVGGDDVLTRRLDEVMTDCADFNNGVPAKTITEALDLTLADVGGNSFDVVALIDGELVQIDFLFNISMVGA
jgi:hypothetical protein